MKNALVHRVGDVATLTQHITLMHQDRSLMNTLRTISLATAHEFTWTAAGEVLLERYRQTIDSYRTAAQTDIERTQTEICANL